MNHLKSTISAIRNSQSDIKIVNTAETSPQSTRFQLMLPFRKTIKGDIERMINVLAVEDTIEKKRAQLFSIEEADYLWEKLAGDGSEREISYKEFKSIRDTLAIKFKPLFKAQVFLQLSKPSGYMPIVLFFNFAVKKLAIEEAMLDLYSYDQDKDGMLSLQELELFINEHVATLPRLKITPAFLPFYTRACVKKFQFFLDPNKKGLIKIIDILKSHCMLELFELRGYDIRSDQDGENWFTFESANRIYNDFISIDKEDKGFININDALSWPNWSLTDLVTRRVFREYQTTSDELDFEAYLELILALLNIHKVESVKYWFKVLDTDQKGYLNCDDFTLLLTSMNHKLSQMNYESIETETYVTEIFDMIGVPHKIKISDLIKSGVSGRIIHLLIEIQGLLSHESAEVWTHHESDQPETDL